MQKKEEKQKSPKSNKISPTEIAIKTLKHWPWILISLTVWLCLAVIYLTVKQPTYMRTAKILITDENGNNSFSLPSAALTFGMFGSNQVLLDEISKLESPDLMEAVIKRLNLDVRFEKPGEIHREQVYGDSIPVTLSAPSWGDDDYAKMQIDITPDGQVTLSNMKFNAMKIDPDETAKGRLGQPIKTPAGYITLVSTPAMQKGQEYTLYMVKTPINDAIKAYKKSTDIIRDDEQANAVSITVYDKSAQRANDMIVTIIDVYNENWARHKNLVKDVTTRFIDERLEGIKNELLMADKDISNFQSAHQLPDLEKAAAIYLTDNQMADQHLLELTNQVKVARYMRNYMEGAAHTNEVLPTFTSLGIGTSALERQISEYNEKLMERNRLASNSSSSHPMIVQLDQQLEQMRSAIINSTNNEIASLNTQIENVLSKKSEVENKIAAAPKQVNTILETGRQQKVLESLYVFLLQKREENEMNQAYGLVNTDIIAKPRGEKKPAKPRKPLILAVAFFMGLFTPYCLTFLSEVRNNKIRDKKDLDDLTVPVIGEIPLYRKSKQEKKDKLTNEQILVGAYKNDEINDAFRMLRTDILTKLRNLEINNGKALMISSLDDGTGKTFISANLACSLAMASSKVILIDGDIHKGDASNLTGSSSGLAGYLSGATSDWKENVVTDNVLEGAHILPAGNLSYNPAELLENERFHRMIEEMRKTYDYIIIDSPSAKRVADAKIIGKSTDLNLFVIRPGVSELASLEQTERLYEEKTFKNMFLILNGIRS